MTKHGWKTAVQGDGKGWPDICLVGNGRILFIECKVAGNTLSPEQAAWIEALRSAGQEAVVWTDDDWKRGIVEAALKRGPGGVAA